MEQIGTYEECDTFLELYSLAKKGDNGQVAASLALHFHDGCFLLTT